MTEELQLSREPGAGSVAKASTPSVRVVLTFVEGADVGAALSSIRRQAYDGVSDVVVIGSDGDLAEGVGSAESVEVAISNTDSSVDYIWIVHADARPRPDALASLVREVERNDAGLGASKILRAGTKDELESIGSATDVFGEPYTGLDEGEVDLQQYDVVREVAFVESVSMLVRRDLARGLGGLDPAIPPGAAGLDFSQRARIAGGSVIIVPSSEVYHQAKCVASGRGWKERAGRLRSMVVAYRLLTLIWVLPIGFIVGLFDSILNLLLLRWRPLGGFVATWAWNLAHVPSTLKRRRRSNSIRNVGDEELFRFQTPGSVRLRRIGSEIASIGLSLFDDDQALTRGAKRLWASPGIMGAILALIIAVIGSRGFLFSGVPNTGFSFPFEPPSWALGRFVGGWNDASLGSPAPVHPSTGVTGLVSLVWFGAQGAARTLMTLGFGVVGVIGMGRFLGRLGLRGPGRYLAGLVALAGPGTAALAGLGSWNALAAAAILPWALRAVFVHPSEQERDHRISLGWALVLGWVVAALSPVLVVVPLLAALIFLVGGGSRTRLELAAVSALGGLVSVSFLSGDSGWLLDVSRRQSIDINVLWVGVILVAFVPVFMSNARNRRLGSLGGLFALGGLLVARLPLGGPGIEEAALITASIGTAIVVGVALDRREAKLLPVVGALAAVGLLLVSVGSLMNGYLGMPSGDVNDDLSFAESLADEGLARRVLYVSERRDLVPAESRPGPGFWYRLLDGFGTTSDEVWLPKSRAGDAKLERSLTEVTAGGVLRPGLLLGEYSIGWIVISGPETDLDQALSSQLDIIPLPLESATRVYENPVSPPIAINDRGEAWIQNGLGFEGDAGTGRVAISMNYTNGWEPNGGPVDWYTSVSASAGNATYTGHWLNVVLGYGAIALLAAGFALVAWGRRPQ